MLCVMTVSSGEVDGHTTGIGSAVTCPVYCLINYRTQEHHTPVVSHEAG